MVKQVTNPVIGNMETSTDEELGSYFWQMKLQQAVAKESAAHSEFEAAKATEELEKISAEQARRYEAAQVEEGLKQPFEAELGEHYRRLVVGQASDHAARMLMAAHSATRDREYVEATLEAFEKTQDVEPQLKLVKGATDGSKTKKANNTRSSKNAGKARTNKRS